MSQLLHLRENELDQLAEHLGHSMSVHRQYYRLPNEALVLAKVSKLLNIFEQGRIQEFRDKTLDDIHIDEDTKMFMEESPCITDQPNPSSHLTNDPPLSKDASVNDTHKTATDDETCQGNNTVQGKLASGIGYKQAQTRGSTDQDASFPERKKNVSKEKYGQNKKYQP